MADLNELKEQIKEIQNEVKKSLEGIDSSKGLYEYKKLMLDGKRGKIGSLMRGMGSVPKELKGDYGKNINALKEWATDLFDEIDNKLKQQERNLRYEAEKIDVTEPAAKTAVGRLNPITMVKYELTDIFTAMGFEVYEGTEIETDYYNFTALNTPDDHPARDMQDTFYFPDGTLLRTHTSPVQIRAMLEYGAPLRIICPGKVYRRDNDTTHSPMFNQMEGLLVDKNVPFSVMKGTMAEMLNAFFGKSLKYRFRASYFPFTEPSMELDIECVECSGHNEHCRVCHGTGWLEVAGMGMVHPNVIRAGKIDPDEYNGFAFGIGLDRMSMLKYGISDLRLLFDGNVSYFLSGFGGVERC